MDEPRQKPPFPKRGRPATGRDPIIVFRAPAELIARIEAVARHEKINRSQAVRLLVEKGLEP